MKTTIKVDSERSLTIGNCYKGQIGLRLETANGNSSYYEVNADELLQAVKAHHSLAAKDK